MRRRERREVIKQVNQRSTRLYCIVLDTNDTG